MGSRVDCLCSPTYLQLRAFHGAALMTVVAGGGGADAAPGPAVGVQ